MDVLVHLSLREGLPRTVIQAFAAAKPVVGYNLDGTPEVVKDGETGYLCEAEQSLPVALSVVKLLKNKEKAREMGEKGRELVREKWDWRYMVKCLEEDYQTLLEEKSQVQL